MTTPFTLPPVNKENIPQCADLSHKIFPEVLSGAQRLSSKVSKIRSSSTCAASPIDFFTRKALLAEFINLLPDVVCIIDAKGSLLAHNSKFKKSILAFDQIDASDPSSIDIFRFISPKDHVNFASSLQAVAGSKASEEEPSYVQSVNTGDIGLTGMSNEGCELNDVYQWTLSKSDAFPDSILMTGRKVSHSGDTPVRARPSRHSLGRSSFAVSPSKVDKTSTFPITPPCGSPEKERSLSLLSPCAIDCIEDMTSRSVPRNTARILRCLSLQRLPSVSPETPYRKPLAIQTLSPITSPSFSASLLRKKVEELESKLAAKQNFVRSVGHEIRTPLSVVLSGLLVLARDLESGDGSSRLSRKEAFSSFKSMKGGLVSTVESIYHACSSAIDVLNDLLIYEKIESKLLIQEPSLVHLAVLVENVVSQFQVQAEQSEVYMSLGNSLLPEESSLVYADAHKITQVLRNLVSNAIKFTPAGGEITINLKVIDSKIRVDVTDSGVGLSTENQVRLFKEIIQFSALELQQGKGSGLGLFIAKQIIDANNGTIGVISKGLGMGTSFFFELPLVRDAAPSIVSQSPSHTNLLLLEPPCAPTVMGKKLRLLIVDDAAMCRKMTARVLSQHFSVCDEADDGASAVEMVKRAVLACTPYDVILMDSCMREVDGPAAAEIIRKSGYINKIYGVTGSTDQSDHEAFTTAGADAVFVKPLTSESYNAILKSI